MGTWLGLVGLVSAWAGPVVVSSGDVSLQATQAGAGGKGVVLVHAPSRSQEDWADLASRLASNGFLVLNVDLPGHGRSKPPEALAAGSWQKAVDGIEAAVAHLRKAGAKDVSLVAAEASAALAATAIAEGAKVDTLVLASPGLAQEEVRLTSALPSVAGLPTLILAGEEDAVGAKIARSLHGQFNGAKQLTLIASPAKGARLLGVSAEAEGAILGWLNGTWKTAEAARAATARPSSEIETTGTKLEDWR
jgi:alpha-beta hydrolase superfamily lysophospholipase